MAAEIAYQGTWECDAAPKVNAPAFAVAASAVRDGDRLTVSRIVYKPGTFEETGRVSGTATIRDGRPTLRYTFRPAGPRLVSWGPRVFFRHVEDHEGLRLDRQVEAGFGFEFPRQTEVEFEVTGGRERLRPQDAPGLTSPQDYSASGFDVGVASAEPASSMGAGV